MAGMKFWAGILLASSCALVQAAGNPEAGKKKAEACGACHGEDGNSSAPIFPKVAEQHAPYIAKQLHDFKSQKRSDPTMGALSEPLSAVDIDDLAAYYAKQRIKPEQGKPNPHGEMLYRAGNPKTGLPACTGCHGPNGSGNPQALFPAINGQYAAYIEKTLQDFQSGARANDANGVMRTIAGKMSEEDIRAVSDYLSSQHSMH